MSLLRLVLSFCVLLVSYPRLSLAGCRSISDCYYNGWCASNGQCHCYSGYGGHQCEYYCDYCYNGGTCVGDYNCSCPAGYTGSSCDEIVCSPSCENGGTCTYGVCFCPSGYYGRHCQSSNGGSTGIIAASVAAGLFILGCSVCVVFLRIWLRSRIISAQRRSQTSVIPTSGNRVVVVSQTTHPDTRPPDAPPPYMSSDPKPHTENCSTLPPGSELTTPTPGPNPPYSGPTPPYSGPSPLYTGPSPPETGVTPPNMGTTPPYSGPSPSYPGPNQSSFEATVPEEDNVGDDVPLLPGN